MSTAEILDVMQRMLVVCLQIAGPVLLASIAIGLVIAIFQAATQIHEQTLTFVPKVLVIALMLLLMGGWISSNITDFFHHIFDLMVLV